MTTPRAAALCVVTLALCVNLSATTSASASDSHSPAAPSLVGAPAPVRTATRVTIVGQLLGTAAARDALALAGGTAAVLVAEPPTPPAAHIAAHATFHLAAGTQVETHTAPAGAPTPEPATPGATASAPGAGTAANLLPTDTDPFALPPDTWSTRTPGSPGGTGVDGARPCPVRGSTWFTDTWGAPRPGGRTHEGTDLFAAEGADVVAMSNAVVVQVHGPADQSALGGITLSYVDAAGDRWYNAHLAALAPGLTVGTYLAQGQTIGQVGHTGDAATTPPHLHLEWHPAGGEAAPDYALLRSRCP